MHKFVPALMLLAAASISCQASVAVERPFAGPKDRASAIDVSGTAGAIMLVGGMGGGGTGGGMGGGARGMGGMTGGGMGEMTGGGMGGFGAMPGNSLGGAYGGADRTGGGAAQYSLCVTPYDRCSLASSPGSLRRGSSCTCSTGHQGTIK